MGQLTTYAACFATISKVEINPSDCDRRKLAFYSSSIAQELLIPHKSQASLVSPQPILPQLYEQLLLSFIKNKVHHSYGLCWLSCWFFFFFPLLLTAHPFDGLELQDQCSLIKYYPYIVSNEEGQDELLEQLAQKPRLERAVHIGWSIEMNYKILLIRQPFLAIICDVNQRVIKFYNLFEELFTTAKSPAQFLDMLEASLYDEAKFFFSRGYEEVPLAVKAISSWMQTEEDFWLLQQMYAEGRIYHAVLDLKEDSIPFIKISQWLREQGYLLDTLYTSNIAEWVNAQPSFIANLQELMEPATLFIDAIHMNGEKWPRLRLTEGALPEFISPAIKNSNSPYAKKVTVHKE